VRKMGASRQAVARMTSFIAEAQRSGTTTALRNLGLGDCVGKAPSEVLGRLLDVMCPVGGTIDEGIAREAFAWAAAEFAQQDLPDIESLDAGQWTEFFVELLSRSIELRVLEEIGAQSMQSAKDVDAIESCERAAHSFIQATVREAVSTTLGEFGSLSAEEIQSLGDRCFEQAFGIWEDMEDEQ